MRTTRRIAIAAFAALLAVSAFGDPAEVTVRSSVDRSTITVGDPILYTLSISWDEGIEVTPPSLGVNLGGFEIQDYKAGEPRKEGGRQVLESSYRITIYDTGEFVIPGVEIAYKTAGGEEKTIGSEPIEILVESVSPDMDGGIADIKGQAEIKIDPLPYLLAATLVLFLAVSAILIIMMIRRRRMRRLLSAEPSFRPPAHELAMKRLNELRGRDLIGQGMIKQYYTELSEIIREYLENRYTLFALEQTTDEIVREAEALDLSRELHGRLGELLRACDLVKFAKHRPPQDAHDVFFEDVRGFVDATKLMPEVSMEDGADAGPPPGIEPPPVAGEAGA